MESPSTASLSLYLTRTEAAAIRALGAQDMEDMMRILPLRYVTPGPINTLQGLQEGDDVSLICTVVRAQDRRMRKRPGSILEVTVNDGVDDLRLTFFLHKAHQVTWHRRRLAEGTRIVVFGTVSFERGTRHDRGPQVIHPRYEIIGDDEDALDRAMQPIPVYPRRGQAKQTTLRKAFGKVVRYADDMTPAIPERVVRAERIPPLAEAMREVHTPRSMGSVIYGKSHLVFEEAFVLQAIFAQRRAQDQRVPAPALTAEGPLQRLLDARLPFELTRGQIGVGEKIRERLRSPHPTSALLQGDVGSGKTVVALRAMLQAVDSGHQAALLAPTEVLAEQHYRTIRDLLGELGNAGQLDGHPDATAVRLLTGSLRTAQRRGALLDITSGNAGIVVGTHALLTESVEFASLALAVIDEQHRFGVDHRRKLRAKGPGGQSPHTLVMTATPIPRTAALVTVGDLDVLTLRDRPGQRSDVASFVVHEQDRAWEERMWARTAEEIAAGRQAFVVCAHIDEDGQGADPSIAEARGVTETARRLAERPEFQGVRIGVLHGRLPAEEKQRAMQQMLEGELDMLVATTVIEVGVDVPNATVMVVMDAERFGVSQLHQLRGRVGRAEHEGIAFFDTRAAKGSETSRHLQKLASTADGFMLAGLDLNRRGVGDLVGEEQSGLGRTVRFLDVLRDGETIQRARDAAFRVVQEDPDLEHEPGLVAAIERRLRDADPDVERS